MRPSNRGSYEQLNIKMNENNENGNAGPVNNVCRL